jgi:hypothetical protein
MRLYEFDDLDRLTFKTKYGMTIEESLKQFEDKAKSITSDYKILSSTSKDKIALTSYIGDFMQEIRDLFDFYNKCNVDNETKAYLDRIIELNNLMIDLFDSL